MQLLFRRWQKVLEANENNQQLSSLIQITSFARVCTTDTYMTSQPRGKKKSIEEKKHPTADARRLYHSYEKKTS